MKAAVNRRYGSFEVIDLEEIPTPEPRQDEIQVRVHAASVNDFDYGIITGKPLIMRLSLGWRKPKIHIAGCDIAGSVTAVGSAVTRWQPGDRVYGDLSGGGFGGFAEYVCVKEGQVESMAGNMSFIDAAGIPQAAVLAWQGLQSNGPLCPDQQILINGAGGGVGTYGVQLAKQHDVQVTGVDSADKLELMRELGFDHAIDYRQQDFTRTGKRYDLIVDAKTTHYPLAYTRALNPGGCYATVGGDGRKYFWIMALGWLINLLSGKKLKLIVLKANAGLPYFTQLFSEGKLKTVVDGPYPLDDIVEALQYFMRAEHKGKVVVTLD